MLWSKKLVYEKVPYEEESELESAIFEVQEILFGPKRIYLDLKRKIGKSGKLRNIPDGYLIDLSSVKDPKLYVVENELAEHDPLKHIAVQILEFSLSFETSPQSVKAILREGLNKNKTALEKCREYAVENGFENVDFLLERIIYKPDSFNALVIIDEVLDELETVLVSRFKFPVEIVTLQKFVSPDDEVLYQFDPFLADIETSKTNGDKAKGSFIRTVDPSDLDTIVVPAREDGFVDTFLGENCWYAIRIHSSMISQIKYIAAYRVAPESAITHVAEIKSIEQWRDTNKYILKFNKPAKKIKPIKLVPKSVTKAPQSPRYTSYEKLRKAKNLDEVF